MPTFSDLGPEPATALAGYMTLGCCFILSVLREENNRLSERGKGHSHHPLLP